MAEDVARPPNIIQPKTFWSHLEQTGPVISPAIGNETERTGKWAVAIRKQNVPELEIKLMKGNGMKSEPTGPGRIIQICIKV